MKEVEKRIEFNGTLVNNTTGESTAIQGSEVVTEKYYSIRKLNRKVMYMDLIDAIAAITNSSREVKLFGHLFSDLDEDNSFKINISQFAKDYEVSRQVVTKLLNKSVACGFTKKLKQGHYFVNPFIVKGSKFRSNKKFEQVQKQWELQ